MVDGPVRGRRARGGRRRCPAHRGDREGLRVACCAGDRPGRASGLRWHRVHRRASRAPVPAPDPGAWPAVRRRAPSRARDRPRARRRAGAGRGRDVSTVVPRATLAKTFDLSGRAAVLTGGHGDLAEAIARVLAELGCGLILAARRVEPCEELAQRLEAEYGVPATAVAADVTDEEDVDRLVAAATDRFGRLDVL